MTAPQPATPGSDGEVCACGHRLAHHVSVGGCCIGACLCPAARPAAPSEPPAEVPAYIRSPALLRDPLLRPQPSEPPAETQQDDERHHWQGPCCVECGATCSRCGSPPAAAAGEPQREQVARWLRIFHDGDDEWLDLPEPLRNGYRDAADELLALLGGPQPDGGTEPCRVYSHGDSGWHCAVTGDHDQHTNAAGTETW